MLEKRLDARLEKPARSVVTKRIVGAKPGGTALESTVGGAGRRGAVAQLTSTNMQTSIRILLRIALSFADTHRD